MWNTSAHALPLNRLTNSLGTGHDTKIDGAAHPAATTPSHIDQTKSDSDRELHTQRIRADSRAEARPGIYGTVESHILD